MLGKDFDDLAAIKPEGATSTSDEVVLDAEGLSHKGTIKPFNFKIRKGEVVGVTGLLGSGRSEMVRCIYGADKAQSGTEIMSGSVQQARGLEMDAIASAVIGGTLLTGGVGNVIGSLFGVLINGTINTLVTSNGKLLSSWANIATAALLCFFIILQSIVAYIRNRKK